MKKFILLSLAIFLMFNVNVFTNGYECCLEGSGTAEDPYLINDIDDLYEFFCPCSTQCSTDYYEGYVELTADIDCNTPLESEGSFSPCSTITFSGNFNGKNHKISNFTHNYGFFRTLSSSGILRNLVLVNVNISGFSITGGIVDDNKGTIVNCRVSGNVRQGIDVDRIPYNGTYGIGGLFGINSGLVKQSHANCYVEGNNFVGGLGGYNEGQVINCSAKGNVSGYDYVGGLLGSNNYMDGGQGDQQELEDDPCPDTDIHISYGYAAGAVSGNSYVGGLVGINSCAIINNSYCTGNVSGEDYVGGFAGETNNNNVNNSYSMGSASAPGASCLGGFVGNNSGSTYNCCFYNTTNNPSPMSAAGCGSSSGVTGLPTSGFTNMSSIGCLFSNNNNNVWSMGASGPILLGTTVPTLTEWAAIIFIGLLAIIGGIFIWRKVI